LLGTQAARLQAQSPAVRLARTRAQLQRLEVRLHTLVREQQVHMRARLTVAARTLETLSPLATLTRGYAIVSDAQGHAVSDASVLRTGDEIGVRLAKGRITATVTQPEQDEG
jgi:exodeoxyribonuclease VII large subunit